ncbi:Murein DD-endopeptidase MepM and murein hydrolase activator NlpD, contain LysM domain [Halopseudomonas xinjiangensis]|uniref:Murein DD-endopeptidase MepM and murein hydrolase activator NlpD, contain LysM domain n=1 Tax=Halopseudomonas xinjiangensis TaxID=487184 RepID=A0A1H1WHF3_9GAMM|nr:peptidoglycan DD-metalloendopeptidase family protein [Halopseudomonas xinjiangensis]SDS96524.1 Murein DD-endopeptidase MepM and murein hydrolase activator NlpD, contain LysM domain [Halopseudomonas xinjiangensis]
MASHKTKTPRYPKSHLVAASGIAAALSIFLLVIPTTDVEAKKTFVQLELDPAQLQSQVTAAAELDNLVSDTITAASPLDLAKPIDAMQAESATAVLQALDETPVAVAETIAPQPTDWVSVTVAAGNTLSVLFSQIGLSSGTLHSAMSSKEAQRFTRLNVGQVIEFKLDEQGDLLAMRSKINDLETIRLDRESGKFKFSKELIEPEVHTRFASGTIDSSLFLSAQRAGLSHNLTMQMANVFGYDVDFAREIRKGDTFEVLFEELRVGDKTVGSKNILAARFVNRGKTFTAVRYTDKQGYSSYYRADGTSMRKAFIRTPVEFARISSRFNPGRRHPVLNKIRAHKGVDYAAATGTPIKATGDGRVVHVGRKGGYGNTVVIKHGQKYQTLYAHMVRYAKGIAPGKNVSQGQVIGYVGMTGLATGPHLHYEFRINGAHVDPLSVKLPASDPIAASERTAFLALSKKLMANLDQHGDTQLAMLQE